MIDHGYAHDRSWKCSARKNGSMINHGYARDRSWADVAAGAVTEARGRSVAVDLIVLEARESACGRTEWGFDKLLPLELFYDTSSGYIYEDSCVFGAELGLEVADDGTLPRKWKVDVKYKLQINDQLITHKHEQIEARFECRPLDRADEPSAWKLTLWSISLEPAKIMAPAKTNMSSTKEEPADGVNLTYLKKAKSKAWRNYE
ncbi:hypothetical protein LguiA_001772 [Lonicera macranthoides]